MSRIQHKYAAGIALIHRATQFDVIASRDQINVYQGPFILHRCNSIQA